MKKTLFLGVGLIMAAVFIAGCGPATTVEKEKGTLDKGTAGAVFELKSPSFANGEKIPVKYADGSLTGGENLSVPLSWAGAPDGTKSFALICVDRNGMAENWVHWVVINMNAKANKIIEGSSGINEMPAGSEELTNSFGTMGYGGMTPPAGSGVHKYEFILYALDSATVDMPAAPSLAEFEAAVKSSTLGKATLTGTMEG